LDADRLTRAQRRIEVEPHDEEVVSIPDLPEETQGPADPEERGSRRPPSDQEVKDECALEILRIHEESYGKGARAAHAFVGNGYVLVVLDDVELLPNEKFLIENGKQDTVTQVRTQYQHAIRASFSAAIERATGRRVTGFASTTSMDEPRFVAEVFKLEGPG
jgi:uncharacterized protein YbcI